MDLDLATRLIGVGLAVAGALMSAPGAVGRLRAGTARSARQVKMTLHRLVALVLRRPPVPLHTASGGSVALSRAGVAGTGHGWSWEPAAPLDARVDKLYQRTEWLSERIADTAREAREGETRLQASLDELTSRLTDEATDLRRRLDDMRARDARVEALSLPLIAAGVALTALSGEVSGYGPLVWMGCMVLLVLVAGAWWALTR